MGWQDMSNTIEKLSDYAHIRLRTAMYFGSPEIHTQEILIYEDNVPVLKEMSWVPAVYTAFREVLDNALDEIVGYGNGNRIDITYKPEDMIFSVQDNGAGIPIDWSDEYKQYLATLVLSEPRSGRNFRIREEVAGTNGIGCSATNYCSEWLKLEVWRDGKSFVQKFKEGEKKLIFRKPTIKDIKSGKVGTKISFKLSSIVFTDLTLPLEFVYSRVYEVAMCNPLLKVYFNGTRIKVRPTPEKTIFGSTKPIIIEIKDAGFKSKFLLVPNFQKSGEHIHSIVNNILAFNNGVHMETFRRFFYYGMIAALGRESKRRKLKPNRSDLNEGLLIFNVTNMKAPNFDSQSKTRLINEEAAKIVRIQLEEEKLFKSIITKNKAWIEEIFARCEARTQKKDASDVSKISKKMMRGKVPDLRDATGKDRTKCILFLGEGKSAISGMNNERDPKIHGGLPLRGKVLNVNGESMKTVLANQALFSIMASIGLTLGEVSDRRRLRYGKVFIAHDMDQDGLNIGALLINFFYTYWPELFDPEQEPFFFIFMTPYVIAKKGKERKYWYARNYHEFNPADYKGWAITRAKGLGTLEKQDWRYSLDNPELYAILDDGKLKEALDLVFNGSRADDRKIWIGL